MARKHQPAAIDTLDEIQSVADRLGEWIQQNLRAVALGVVGLLALVGLGSWWASSGERDEVAASQALAETRNDYLEAMGAPPGAIEVPVLANPEAAGRIREEFSARFEAVADAHRGTVSGALARVEVAQLALEAGDVDRALALFDQTLEEAPDSAPLRGMVLQRAAQTLEDAELWAEAAARHRQASQIADYPLRDWALADAARCLVLAGDRDGARALYAELDAEAPELRLPDYQRAQKRELEAAAQL